jgi:hypothetical protein
MAPVTVRMAYGLQAEPLGGCQQRPREDPVRRGLGRSDCERLCRRGTLARLEDAGSGTEAPANLLWRGKAVMRQRLRRALRLAPPRRMAERSARGTPWRLTLRIGAPSRLDAAIGKSRKAAQAAARAAALSIQTR